MENLSFIPLRAEDREACDTFRTLMHAYSAELAAHEVSPPSETETERWIDSIIRLQGPPERHAELCELDGAPIGFFYGKTDRPEHKGDKKVGYGCIMEFYVKPERRRKGVGTAMFRRLESLFQTDGAFRMYLTADPYGGVPFWTALGFLRTGEVSPENHLDVYEKEMSLVLRPLTTEHFSSLTVLHLACKSAIGEDAPTDANLDSLRSAIEAGAIHFYGAFADGRLVGCCSVSYTWSTFNYSRAGVFEDFYILPEYRHRGIARKLVRFTVAQSGVGSLTVGCADCDVEMYKSLGFRVPIGNLLAYDT